MISSRPRSLGRRVGGACRALLVVACLLPAGRAWAQSAETAETAQAAFTRAYALYADALYAQAAPAFREFRGRYPDHLNTAEALYYQAEATLALGQEGEAVALFEQFERLYPAHPLAFDARLALGKYFYEQERYDRALASLDDVLADEPPADLAAKALYWMGESALRLGRTDEALTYFQRAAEGYRTTETAPVALYAVAYTELQRDRYDAAARAFELLAARYPDSPYARDLGLSLAEVYYELGDYQRAVDEIERRRSRLTGEAQERALFLLAEAHNQLRNSEDAILNYRRFTEGNPESPYYRRALYGLGWNYYREQTYQWAAEAFAQVWPGHDDELAHKAAYYEGVNLKLANRPDQAASAFARVADTWPNGELADRALYELGITRYEQRQWQAAYDAFARLTRAYPESPLLGDALSQLGNTAIARGRFDDALTAYDRAIELDAAPPELKEEVAFQKAWLLYRNREYADAARAFAALRETAPGAAQAGEALFWSAESHFQIGELDRAAHLFQRYLREYPSGRQSDAAHYALGWTYFKQGRYADAATEFERFLDAYRVGSETVPYRTDALLRLADSYYALRRFPEAIRVYRQVADAGEDYALYQVAQALSNSGNRTAALSAFQGLLDEYPDTEWRNASLYSLGYLHFQIGNYDQAIERYRQLVDTAPRDPLAAKALYGIGDAHFNAGQLEEAAATYQDVLRRYPNSPFAADAAAGIQYAFAAQDDPAGAERLIDEFVAANPDSPVVDELRFRQAEVKYQSGRRDEALDDFRRFVRTARDATLLPQAYFYLGSIYLERDEPQEAESYLRQLLQNYPEAPRTAEAAQLLGQQYLDTERYDEALRLYRTLETLAGGDPRLVAKARYGQSVALMQLGRTREAEQLLREAIDANPDAPESVPALLGLARVHEANERPAEALRLYAQVVDRSTEEAGAEALVRLGDLLVRQGRAREAVEQLSRLPVLFAGYPDWLARGLLAQARAFRSLGQRGDAVRLYDRLIEQYDDTPYAETARQEKEAL